jgi:hypothetical protein
MEIEIEYLGVPLSIEGTYYPSEAQVMYYSDMSGYPGSPAEFEIIKITVTDSDVDIWELLSQRQIDEITELVIQKTEE